jgi:hypothetical protein
MHMRRIDYDAPDKNTGNTENQIATDESMVKKYGNLGRAYQEGFAASSGVRGQTAETDGGETHPETADEPSVRRIAKSVESENAGLADS